MSDNKIVKVEIEVDEPERIEADEEHYEIGQWYWITIKESGYVDEDDEEYDPNEADEPGQSYYSEWVVERLGCVSALGSNYVESTIAGSYRRTIRLHLDKAHKYMRPAPEWREHVRENVLEHQQNVQRLMGEVHEITKRLGMSPRLGLPAPQQEQSYALATLSGTEDVKGYENALVRAKEKELPELFQQIKNENEAMAHWLKAETIPLRAMAESMQGVIAKIDDRIFNVSLYAGLTEQVHQIRDGEPASYDEKLHLLQRKHYMDEECLLNYRHGGMDFESIAQFDEWICKDENFERIFPFPRCMVAFQVRRETKARSWGGSPTQLFINMRLADADRNTYLYIRNGEQLYWLGCDLEFGEWIFPEKGGFDLSRPMMVKKDMSRYSTITVDDYEVRCEEQAEIDERVAEWEAEHPYDEWYAAQIASGALSESWPWPKERYERENPHRKHVITPNEWRPFDQSFIYFDEAMEVIEKEVKYYNRIALIIQGLYDRSEILHPHPPVKTWDPQGFDQAIKLCYDGSGILYDGDPPSWEEYVAKCNESIDENSVLIGQDEFWQRKEAKKYNEDDRRHRGSRYDRYEPEFHKPYGNPGPGYLAIPSRWQKRAQKATFTWNRQRQTSNYYEGKRYGDPIKTRVVVPVNKLFNVSAYKPGDYLQFFQDPRTRAQYLQWAPALLTAEEYHAGNLEPQEPVE